MKFGLFYQLPCTDWQSPYQRYQEVLEQIQLADEVGFDHVWLAELHFNPRFSITPSPLMLATAAAERTKRIRLGVAVSLLPLHNPVRIAEDVATLDVLSNGRAEFGAGRGATPSHYQGYNVPQQDNRERFLESLDFILKAWTNDEFSFNGKYHNVTNLQLVPKPVQKPHPPVRIASNSEDTFELVGNLGYGMFATPVIVPMPKLKDGARRYRETLEANGHPIHQGELSLAIPTSVSGSPAEAVARPEASVMNYLHGLVELFDTSPTIGTPNTDVRLEENQNRIRQMTYATWCKQVANYGDPGQCIEGIHELDEEFHLGEYICWFELGGLIPHEQVMANIRMFAEKVVPHFS